MIVLPDLPYDYAALEPVISELTMRTHHDRHHARYVEVANTLLTAEGSMSILKDVVSDALRRNDRKLFNNAAQALNHGFFWVCMSPDATHFSGALGRTIETAFGDIDGMRDKFIGEGVGHFGSGWVWLVSQGGELAITTTHDGDTVARMDDLTPLLVCDLWEHAYYLDHKNDRGAYLKGWWDRLVNWSFVERQFEASVGNGAGWTYPVAE